MIELHDSMTMFELNAINVVRSVYLVGVATGLVINSVPLLKRTILNYGSRAQSVSTETHVSKGEQVSNRSGKPPPPTDKSLSWVLLLTSGVPHSWFIHFYVVSVSLSLFWGFSLFTKGPAFRMVSQFVDTDERTSTMKISQVHITWLLMLVQGVRRLLESRAFMKKSASKMPWSIYGIGILYYVNMSFAVWIEGTKAILKAPAYHLVPPLMSIRTTLGLILFAFASGVQYDCHAYLASLDKYTLPMHPAFHQIVCPHYTAECVLYLALAFIAAPPGQVFNQTLLLNVVFVVVNLGLVANETKRWSEGKFGKDSVKARARMIPHIW